MSKWLHEAKCKVLTFSVKKEQAKGMWLASNGSLCYRLNDDDKVFELMKRKDVFLPGDHNLENVMASALAALVLGQEVTLITERLKNFKGVSHRLEYVSTVNTISYINDSKGTNPDATIKAVCAFDKPMVLILGGRNKGSDFSELSLIIKKRVDQVVLLGEAKEELALSLDQVGFKNYNKVSTLKEAVYLSKKLAVEDGIVLLSPACASWDMFDNFEQRGDMFKELVNDIEKEFRKK